MKILLYALHYIYLTWLRLDCQFLDTLSGNKGLCAVSPSSDAKVGGGVGTVLQTLKQAVLLFVPSRGREGDGLDLGRGSHVELVLQRGAGFGGH